MNEILNSVTLTEVTLFATTITFLICWLAKRERVKTLTFHLMDARDNSNKFYVMYIQLSNSTLDITKRWQSCQDENKELLKTLHSSNKLS